MSDYKFLPIDVLIPANWDEFSITAQFSDSPDGTEMSAPFLVASGPTPSGIISQHARRNRQGKLDEKVTKRRKRVAGAWRRLILAGDYSEREIPALIAEQTGLERSDIDNDIRILKLRTKK